MYAAGCSSVPGPYMCDLLSVLSQGLLAAFCPFLQGRDRRRRGPGWLASGVCVQPAAGIRPRGHLLLSVTVRGERDQYQRRGTNIALAVVLPLAEGGATRPAVPGVPEPVILAPRRADRILLSYPQADATLTLEPRSDNPGVRFTVAVCSDRNERAEPAGDLGANSMIETVFRSKNLPVAERFEAWCAMAHWAPVANALGVLPPVRLQPRLPGRPRHPPRDYRHTAHHASE